MIAEGTWRAARPQNGRQPPLTDMFSAERHRIERDLHDGAQQRIVALGFTLGRLEHELAQSGNGPALALARQATAENQQVLADLRDLVRAIRPQALTDLGLGAALDEVAARNPIPTQISVRFEGRPDALVEETGYFLVVEALTNAARHSSATSIEVELSRNGEWLTVRIQDNGEGGAQVRDGGGLAGLIDRVAALGGRLDLSSPPGGPTRISAQVPWQVPYERASEVKR